MTNTVVSAMLCGFCCVVFAVWFLLSGFSFGCGCKRGAFLMRCSVRMGSGWMNSVDEFCVGLGAVVVLSFFLLFVLLALRRSDYKKIQKKMDSDGINFLLLRPGRMYRMS